MCGKMLHWCVKLDIAVMCMVRWAREGCKVLVQGVNKIEFLCWFITASTRLSSSVTAWDLLG